MSVFKQLKLIRKIEELEAQLTHEKSRASIAKERRVSEKNYPPRLWAEPRPHLIIHGLNTKTMASDAYDKSLHEGCVPYISLTEHADLLAAKDAELSAIRARCSELEGRIGFILDDPE